MATNDTAAKFTVYAVFALKTWIATSHNATKISVVNDTMYPKIK
jgi:hypothetical protein